METSKLKAKRKKTEEIEQNIQELEKLQKVLTYTQWECQGRRKRKRNRRNI